MSNQHRVGTKPEIELRQLLFARGLRYRVALRVPGAPRRTIDVAFPRRRLAVFIDGCFWHGCPDHFVPPRNNAAWWSTKIAANAVRDRDTDTLLRRQGWDVLRFWEHSDPADSCAEIVAHLVADLGH